MTAHEHRLIGCRPEPLGSYLKALGVFRLVAEQADPGVTAWWAADGFVLTSSLDDEELTRFLLESYRPTPLVSPWNSSSGFGPEGVGELRAIEASTDSRLVPYREAIAVARRLLATAEASAWPKDKHKENLLALCRSRLPDGCVPWIDAAVVLVDGGAVYPPALGTGGNDGRLEFSRNFHQRVLDVLGITTARGHDRAAWLADALYDHGRSTGVRGRSPGQFDPGAAGGANSAPAGAADSVLNPWDWVLLMEGSLLLASGSARRLSTGASGRAAAPFTVEASAGGYASASDAEKTRGELWAPLWSRPATLPETRRLFAEGRADWRKGHARSGLDVAKAAASLGVDRGITSFSRHAFVERFGLSTVAVSVGRFAVRERPAVAPLAELDGWLGRVRRGGNPPAGVAAGVRAVDRASFELAAHGGPGRLLAVLVEAARLEIAVGRATAFRSRAQVPPVRGLDAGRWVPLLALRDAGPEVRLAACLASGRDDTGAPGARAAPGALRLVLRPLRLDARGRPDWADAPAVVEGLGRRSMTSVLAAAHARRAIQLGQERRASAGGEQVGLTTRFGAGHTAALEDVTALAQGTLDDARLGNALAAFLLLDWSASSPPAITDRDSSAFVPAALAVLAPFYAPQPPGTSVAPDEPWSERLRLTGLHPEAGWPAALAADRTGSVLDAALRRLRIAGLQPVPTGTAPMVASVGSGAGPRLAAALLCRLSPGSRMRLLEQVCPDVQLLSRPESESGRPRATGLPQGELHA